MSLPVILAFVASDSSKSPLHVRYYNLRTGTQRAWLCTKGDLRRGIIMRPDKLTVKAAEAIQAAERIARDNGHAELTPIHLLAALVAPAGGADSESSIVVPILQKAGASVSQIRSIVQSELGRLPKVSGGSLGASRELQAVLDAAEREADRMKDQYISTEHLLLALAEVKSDAKEILTVSGANRDAILAALKAVRGSASVTSQDAESTYQALQRYG